VKLIAEPWDVGEGGYQVGNFPVKLGRVERHLPRLDARLLEGRGRARQRPGLPPHRLERPVPGDGRKPSASINFITAHDGFTLRDTVSYNDKHNEANKEDNRDGHNDNRSWNCGAEGPTDDEEVNAARAPAAQLPRHAAAVAGHADAAGRRRVRQHAAGQQQRLLPGQRDQLVDWRRTQPIRCNAARSWC
jgi:pullulanase/glycogen debranching enzyme